MRYFIFLLAFICLFAGCSNTWNGIKTDTSEAVDWTKGKVNDGATYVKEKTE